MVDIDWWFKSDNQKIRPNQYDCFGVILHELIHGLGFISSWDDSLESDAGLPTTGLTPDYLFYGKRFGGFLEYVFDRYVSIIDSKKKKIPISQYACKLNNSVPALSPFSSLSKFADDVRSSSQWKYAKLVLKAATTNNGIVFTPAKHSCWKQDIYLETCIRPFATGSSISHVSKIKYGKTSDFIMTWKPLPGVTTDCLVKKGGNYKSPLGPRVISVLETIGYPTEACPNPIEPTY